MFIDCPNLYCLLVILLSSFMTLRVIIFHITLNDTFVELKIGLFQAHEFYLNFYETNFMKVEDSLSFGCDTVSGWMYPHVVGHFNRHLDSPTHWHSVHSKIMIWVPSDTVSSYPRRTDASYWGVQKPQNSLNSLPTVKHVVTKYFLRQYSIPCSSCSKTLWSANK
jgi:hypothetical protein